MTYCSPPDKGVFAFLASPETTTITTAGTYYPINGTFTNSPLEEFQTTVDPAIQYINETACHFEIDWHVSCSGDSNSMTVHFGIKKNDALITSSIMGAFLRVADEIETLSGTTVTELIKDDKIQLVVTANGDGDIVNVSNFTTTIRGFFR